MIPFLYKQGESQNSVLLSEFSGENSRNLLPSGLPFANGDSGPSALAAFTYTQSYGTETIYFYADNTWECIETMPDFNYTGTDYKGTYKLASGDFTNGTLDFTVVEHNGEKSGWEKVSLEIKDGVFYLKVWDTPAKVEVNDSTLDKYTKK